MTTGRTLRGEAAVEGAGLFTGATCRVVVRPAPQEGVWFLRGAERIQATVASLLSEPAHPALAAMGGAGRSTNLARRGKTGASARALTVEHLLSALAGLGVGLGVTGVEIELSADEVPILDGSALDFVMALGAAEVVECGAALEPVTLAEPATVLRGEASITALPRQASGWSVRYELDYGAPSSSAPLAPQVAMWDGTPAMYTREIAPARTFCTDREAEAMRQAGLFANLSPREMLVIGPEGPIDNTYRFDNEPARHKVLDVIGDLSLVGRPIQADIVARRSGHALNHELARRLAAL